MKKKITLQDILAAINTFSSEVDRKFKSTDDRFESIDRKFDVIDKKFDSINQRLDTLEITAREIQKSIEALQDEMRGIHKVLDRFDWRITRLEKHLGLEIKGSAG